MTNEKLSDFDELLYRQCREYIKLYLLNEELHSFKNYDEEDFPYRLQEVMNENSFKANVLLREIYISLMRLKSQWKYKNE